jgi:hypothetical protein
MRSLKDNIESARAAAGNFFLFAWIANLVGGGHSHPQETGLGQASDFHAGTHGHDFGGHELAGHDTGGHDAGAGSLE